MIKKTNKKKKNQDFPKKLNVTFFIKTKLCHIVSK